MQIKLNGEPTDTKANSIAALLIELQMDGRVATALNEDFVPADARETTLISEGDRIEILAPMQGG